MEFRALASCSLAWLLLLGVSHAAEKSEPVQCLSALAWQREQEFQKPANDEAAFRGGPFAFPRREDAKPLSPAFNLPFAPSAQAAEVAIRLAAGVRAIHAFEDAEAERWFRDAARLDPPCASAWLGLAIANEKLPSRALYFLDKAKTATGRTPREDGWIAAYDAFFQTAKTSDLLERLEKLSVALRSLAAQHPDDRCAETFALRYRIIRANLCRIPLSDADKVAARYDRWADEEGGDVLLFYPILLWLKFDPEIAAKHTQALTEKNDTGAAWRLAAEPALAMGDYEKAAMCLERSLAASSTNQAAVRMPWAIALAWCYYHGGQQEKAMSLASRLASLPRKPAFTGLEAVDDTPGESYLLALHLHAQLCMAAGDWAKLAELSAPASTEQDSLLVRAHRLYWAALANSAIGRADTARLQRSQLAVTADEVARTPYLNRHADLTSRFVRGAEAFSSLVGGRITPYIKDVAHMPGFVLASWMSKAGAVQAAQAMVAEELREHPGSKPLSNLASDLKGAIAGKTVIAAESMGAEIPDPWVPLAPSGFSLPDKSGAAHQLRDFAGRPVLVIFFLGQGCAHCVEQLQKFRPLVNAYADAGISIVTIGTDSVARLAESLGPGPELDPELPYLILSDESMSVFKAWHCYDDFLQKPLHGTFLLDASGRMLWSDISHDPYSQASFLLGECQRLLKAHSPQPAPPDQATGK